MAYKKCRRRKRYRRPATLFDYDWEANLLHLQRELQDGSYRPGEYRHFMITEPKPRKISAAPFRDRVVHHALVNVLEPIFERRFIFDSYACRKGKGTHRALDRAQRYLRRFPWYLKTDIVRFFPHVDHALLLGQLELTLRDRRVLDLITVILCSGEGVLEDQTLQQWFPGDCLWDALRPKGLPIGNLTSQFLANVFLDPVDHFVKETLCVPGYVRYSDDLLLFGESKQQLWAWRDALAQLLATLRLRRHQHKTHVRPSCCGVAFLGFRVYREGRRLLQEPIKRFNARLRRMKADFRERQTDCVAIRASLTAWLAHATLANTAGIRQKLWSRVRFVRVQ